METFFLLFCSQSSKVLNLDLFSFSLCERKRKQEEEKYCCERPTLYNCQTLAIHY